MTGLPDPAARSPDEAAFLATILADLPNDLPKLVYADWLDDRGDDRAAVLREAVEAVRAGKAPTLPRKPPGWMHLTGLTLWVGLHKHRLADLAPVLLPLARPAVSLHAKTAADKKLAVGASKFGGDPDLPAGTPWPAPNGRPLGFLAQIDLADVAGSPAASGLPAGGLLSVFHDLLGIVNDDRHYADHAVLFTPPGRPLVRHPQPSGQPDENRTPACKLTFAERLTLPDVRSPWAKELAAVGDRDMDYLYLRDELGERHHLLGYPTPIQGDILGRKTRRHLLTLAGDAAANWEFMDGGMLYYTLTAGDLAKGKLDRVRFALQSG